MITLEMQCVARRAGVISVFVSALGGDYYALFCQLLFDEVPGVLVRADVPGILVGGRWDERGPYGCVLVRLAIFPWRIQPALMHRSGLS